MTKSKSLNFTPLFAFLIAAAISACASSGGAGNEINTISARDNFNWDGQYTGVIPSASGMGIDIQLTLRADQTYTLVYNYIGKSGFITENSTFSWNETGSVITLKNTTFPPYYRVEKDHLLQLDMEGKKITGNLAEMYILKKAE